MYFIMSKSLGTHIILDFYGCNPESMMRVSDVQGAMQKAARLAHFTVVTEEYHQFEPHGVSGATIIQESNCCFHSWPEHGYASIDIFYCGENNNVNQAIDFLINHFQPKHIERKDLPRGIPRVYEQFSKK